MSIHGLSETDGVEPHPSPTLLDVVTDLRRDLAALRLSAEDGADGGAAHSDARALRDRLARQLDERVLPRLRALALPAVVVVAGSTGAGKSTLVNSLVGADVSPASVLRPTTREPVVVHHPEDGPLLAAHPVLALARAHEHDAVPRGVALLDAPDLDSFEEANRSLASRLMDAADLWLFVTTPARYGDALPWAALARAQERGTAVAVVLNRVRDADAPALRRALLERLRDQGLVDAPMFVVPDAGPTTALLAPDAVADLRAWLTTLAGRDQGRAAVLRSLRGSLATLEADVRALIAAAEEQDSGAHHLAGRLREVADAHAATAVDALETGVLAAGRLGAAWHAVLDADPGMLRLTQPRLVLPRRAARARTVALAGVRARVRDVVAELVDLHRAAAASDAAGEPAVPAEAGLRLAEDWLDAATVRVAPVESRGARAARTAVGDAGLGTLLAGAAVGVTGMERLLASAAGAHEGAQMVRGARADLAERVRRAIDDAVVPYVDAAGASAPGDEVAALHLRAGELRRLV